MKAVHGVQNYNETEAKHIVAETKLIITHNFTEQNS